MRGGKIWNREVDKLERDVLTLEQAAELLQVSQNTLRKLIQEGQIPARKVGREWRFSRQVLLDWVACKMNGDKKEE